MNRIPIPNNIHMVIDGHQAHPRPGLDQTWGPAEKLAWHAAVVQLRTGLQIGLYEPTPGRFCITVNGPGGSMGLSDTPFASAWDTLSAIEVGARAASSAGWRWGEDA